MRILVTGKDGQLGRSIQKLIANTEQTDNFVFTGREELDLEDRDSITRYFDANDRFDIILNCAAYTSVDKAEEESDLANQINHLAVRQMAGIASAKKTRLIHISTDYVFDGESNGSYKELDQTNPINVYGKTKLAGEKAIQELMPANAIIIRTSWVYSEYGNNFVKTMLELGKEKDTISVVGDQMGSPTYAPDLAEVILSIVNNDGYQNQDSPMEVYHYSNEAEISWYEFAKEVFNLTGAKCIVNPIGTAQYPTPARRPKNTLMNKNKIVKTLGVYIKPWRKSLKRCLGNLDNHAYVKDL